MAGVINIVTRKGGEGFGGSASIEAGKRQTPCLWQLEKHEKGEFTCTLSCGVAIYPDYGDANLLADAADRALYKAKAAGRNQIVLADH